MNKKLSTKTNDFNLPQRQFIADHIKSSYRSSSVHKMLYPSQQTLGLDAINFLFLRAHFDYEVIDRPVEGGKEGEKEKFYIFKYRYKVPGIDISDYDITVEFSVKKDLLDKRKW